MKYLHEFQPPIIHGDIRGVSHDICNLDDFDLI